MAGQNVLDTIVATSEREHEHVAELLQRVKDLLDKHKQLAKETALAAEALRQFVVGHFALEENSPLFKESSEHPPFVWQTVKELLLQHRMLKDTISRLSEYASRQCPLPEGLAEFAIQFTQFEHDLLDHEHREVGLWQRAYNSDLGTKD